jgi:hypothetical protein
VRRQAATRSSEAAWSASSARCADLGVPFGFHVESVSIRKAEIEAATDLAVEVGALLRGTAAG